MKGKKGAQAYRREDVKHLEDLAAMKAVHEAKEASWLSEKREMQASLDRLAGGLERAARELADERVAAAQREAAEALTAERSRQSQQLVELGQLLSDHWECDDLEHGVTGLLRIFNISYGEMFSDGQTNRRVRRATAGWARRASEMQRGMGQVK